MTRSARALGPVGAFALVFCVACGGGGGDGGPSGPYSYLASYAFTIGNTNAGGPFEVEFSMGGGDNAVQVSHTPGLTGTRAISPYGWTFDVGSGMAVDTDAGVDPLFGAFTMSVTTQLPVPENDPPPSGAIRVDASTFYTVITFTATGVDLSIDGGAPVSYTHGDFEDLHEDLTASAAEQVSGFSVQILRFMIERYDAVMDLLEELIDVSDLEEGYNPRSLTGATWPSGYTLTPATIANPGTGSLSWNDRDFSDDVNTGDDLSWGLWEFRPHSDAEWMYDGGMSFQNLVESVDGTSTVLSVGFVPNGGRDGGVFHDGMHIRQMDVDNGLMTVTETETLFLGGAFTFQLNQP